MRRPRNVHVLIDWNSELVPFAKTGRQDTTEAARQALRAVCRKVGQMLREKAGDDAFFLILRAYTGWRRGFEPTERRKSLERVINGTDGPNFEASIADFNPSNRQVIRSLNFGDQLLGARRERLCGPRTDHHLSHTLQRDPKGNYGEKMVDTALVSDLIFLAMDDDRSWLVVVGQDADLVPGILTAEGIMSGTDRKILYLARGAIKRVNPTMMDLVCRR